MSPEYRQLLRPLQYAFDVWLFGGCLNLEYAAAPAEAVTVGYLGQPLGETNELFFRLLLPFGGSRTISSMTRLLIESYISFGATLVACWKRTV